ncbi:hypothetical protein PCAR4_220075 [Paraburkholderia caribensis]|nr:hypothetical protein PCAR4_220075 [Paraburkholderia caribensis]
MHCLCNSLDFPGCDFGEVPVSAEGEVPGRIEHAWVLQAQAGRLPQALPEEVRVLAIFVGTVVKRAKREHAGVLTVSVVDRTDRIQAARPMPPGGQGQRTRLTRPA